MHPDGRVQRLRPAIGQPRGRSGSPARRAPAVAGHRRGRPRARLLDRRRPHRRAGLAAPVRGRAVLRGPDARGDRRPRRALGRARRVRLARLGAREARHPGRGRPRAGRGQAAARHLPPAVGGQGRRHLARAAVHPRQAGRRALAGRRRRAAASTRATASRSATAPACARPCSCAPRSPPAASSSPRASRENNANVLTHGLVEIHRIGPGSLDPSAVAAQIQPAVEGLAEMPPSAPLPIPPRRRHEPPVRRGRLLRAVVDADRQGDRDLLRRLQPRAARAARRPQGPRPLPAPLRPEPRRPVRRAAGRSPTSASSLFKAAVPPDGRQRLAVRDRPGDLDDDRGGDDRDHPVLGRRRHLRHARPASTASTRRSASCSPSPSAASPSTA